MRKSAVGIMLAGLASAPAGAVGIEDLAKIVLGSGAVLKKAEQNCSNARLTKNDQLSLTFARAAAEQALTISQFQLLDGAANTDADREAEGKSFCQETKKKKPGLMSKIKKAGKALVKARVLGNAVQTRRSLRPDFGPSSAKRSPISWAPTAREISQPWR